MALTGPPPKPSALKILEGNPGRRPLNPNEPQLAISAPKCPGYLDKTAKREWRRIVPILLRMRLLTEADQMMLANWCQAHSMLVEASEKLKMSGQLLKTPSGYVQPNPLMSIIRQSMHTMARISAEFGLTPSARVRLQASPGGPEQPNKFSKFKRESPDAA